MSNISKEFIKNESYKKIIKEDLNDIVQSIAKLSLHCFFDDEARMLLQRLKERYGYSTSDEKEIILNILGSVSLTNSNLALVKSSNILTKIFGEAELSIFLSEAVKEYALPLHSIMTLKLVAIIEDLKDVADARYFRIIFFKDNGIVKNKDIQLYSMIAFSQKNVLGSLKLSENETSLLILFLLNLIFTESGQAQHLACLCLTQLLELKTDIDLKINPKYQNPIQSMIRKMLHQFTSKQQHVQHISLSPRPLWQLLPLSSPAYLESALLFFQYNIVSSYNREYVYYSISQSFLEELLVCFGCDIPNKASLAAANIYRLVSFYCPMDILPSVITPELLSYIIARLPFFHFNRVLNALCLFIENSIRRLDFDFLEHEMNQRFNMKYGWFEEEGGADIMTLLLHWNQNLQYNLPLRILKFCCEY
ncbi:uncharacterized protein MONOS_18547 [Monocercomonoides exilis]|uniref:uncharacterized protein n=1 Tax=Monocercomonoides exilis TaxID=2049356 RepID=UPI003559EC45|nr:hypothetical protein MONOS_18547 [Monocercomonoides exilis]